MSPRFAMNLAFVLAGAGVVAASQAFSSRVTGWLTFAVGLAVLVSLGVGQLARTRGRFQMMLDAAVGALAVWSVVASVVYTGTTLKWLSFGEALGFVGLALIGLVAHELSTERVVHELQAVPAGMRDGNRESEHAAAA